MSTEMFRERKKRVKRRPEREIFDFKIILVYERKICEYLFIVKIEQFSEHKTLFIALQKYYERRRTCGKLFPK